MKTKIKLKAKLIVDVCANSSDASISNGLGEVSYNDIKGVHGESQGLFRNIQLNITNSTTIDMYGILHP